RQELHEQLRVHSHAAAAKVKLEGGVNDLIDRIAADDAFPLTKEEILSHLDPQKYVGRAPSQVVDFVEGIVDPILARYTDTVTAELKV
ncbi:MAG: adenylosuccinate lyase, partial [Clostridia bacterium]|nr:adenylosuccinate lyase [Clostridia bacterium]